MSMEGVTRSLSVAAGQRGIYPDSAHGSLFQYPALFVADVTRFLNIDAPFPTEEPGHPG